MGRARGLDDRVRRRWFYASIRDFFSLIPPRLWAIIDGRPIVVLFSASFAKAHDQGCIDFVKAEFPRQFGGRVPYIIREVSWHVKADNVCAWDGALSPNFLGVAEIGPGYDHSAVPGRTPLVVPRKGGNFMKRPGSRSSSGRPDRHPRDLERVSRGDRYRRVARASAASTST